MRVAVLCHADAVAEPHARELADALGAAGHDVRLLAGPGASMVEALLRRRGFTEGLTAVPGSIAALRGGGFDIAHAFTAADAEAALRAGRAPVVFTCAEALGRDRVADRRLRLTLLRRAIGDTGAVLAGSEAARDALARWLLVDADVLDAGDAAGHERVYRALLAERA